MAKVEANHVFKFSVSVPGLSINKTVYTNIDFSKKYDNLFTKEEERFKVLACTEQEVQNLYFTKEVVEKMRQILADKILSGEAVIEIQCTDWDGGYEVEESELLENIIKIK